MAEENTIPKKKITKHEFFFETPLYKQIPRWDFEDFEHLLGGQVDWYSSKNQIETTYDIRESEIATSTFDDFIYYYKIKLKCRRKENDVLKFFIYKDDNIIEKVWQDPSLADIQFGKIWKKYDKILDSETLKELKKAIGLAAHSSGIWSFVHLRRIFEKLIFKCFYENQKELGMTEDIFISQRMQDKITTLQEHLPRQLVKMKSIYSILSLWIHELDEDTCLGYYSGLIYGIELILDKKIQLDEEKKRDKEAEKKIQDIENDLKSKSK